VLARSGRPTLSFQLPTTAAEAAISKSGGLTIEQKVNKESIEFIAHP
jgi:hypothetical protein